MGNSRSRDDDDYDDYDGDGGDGDNEDNDNKEDDDDSGDRGSRRQLQRPQKEYAVVSTHSSDDGDEGAGEEEDDGGDEHDEDAEEESTAQKQQQQASKRNKKRSRKRRKPAKMGAMAVAPSSGSRPPPAMGAAVPARESVVEAPPAAAVYNDLCCGPHCGACCNCSTTPTGCWRRTCNHRDNVRSYLGNYMLSKKEIAAAVCVLLPSFLILWAIEDTSTASSVAVSWNSHVVFSPLYLIAGLGLAVSVYQQVHDKTNKSYLWAALWFGVFLASVVLFRQARDQQLDSDPALYRGLRYSAWILMFALSTFTGIMHCFHLFSGKFKEIAAELQILSRPGVMDPKPTCCQNVCGPKESISVYLSSTAVSQEAVFIPEFVLWELFLVGKFFDDVTPTTISSFSSFDDAARVHAICMPLYAMLAIMMITSIIDAIVQKKLAHIWAFFFFLAMGSGVAMIRHSNIHASDNDRLDFDALRISGWVTVITTLTLIFTLHAARLPTLTPIVDQVAVRTPASTRLSV